MIAFLKKQNDALTRLRSDAEYVRANWKDNRGGLTWSATDELCKINRAATAVRAAQSTDDIYRALHEYDFDML